MSAFGHENVRRCSVCGFTYHADFLGKHSCVSELQHQIIGLKYLLLQRKRQLSNLHFALAECTEQQVNSADLICELRERISKLESKNRNAETILVGDGNDNQPV